MSSGPTTYGKKQNWTSGSTSNMDTTSIVDHLLLMSLRGTLFLGNLAETELHGKLTMMAADISRVSQRIHPKSPRTITVRNTPPIAPTLRDGETMRRTVSIVSSGGHFKSRSCTEWKKDSALYTWWVLTLASLQAACWKLGITFPRTTRLWSTTREKRTERTVPMPTPTVWQEHMLKREGLKSSTPPSADISSHTKG